jgi:hypothetical protein
MRTGGAKISGIRKKIKPVEVFGINYSDDKKIKFIAAPVYYDITDVGKEDVLSVKKNVRRKLKLIMPTGTSLIK